MKFQSSIKKNLRNFFALCLYASFFSVEIVYNFQLEKFVPSAVTSVLAKTLNHQSFSKFDPQNEKQKVNCRLNKRFQPSFISSGSTLAPDIFTGYADSKYYYGYSYKPQLGIFHLSGPLRAPPVV
jgi:hypothetical protein